MGHDYYLVLNLNLNGEGRAWARGALNALEQGQDQGHTRRTRKEEDRGWCAREIQEVDCYYFLFHHRRRNNPCGQKEGAAHRREKVGQ